MIGIRKLEGLGCSQVGDVINCPPQQKLSCSFSVPKEVLRRQTMMNAFQDVSPVVNWKDHKSTFLPIEKRESAHEFPKPSRSGSKEVPMMMNDENSKHTSRSGCHFSNVRSLIHPQFSIFSAAIDFWIRLPIFHERFALITQKEHGGTRRGKHNTPQRI